MNTRFLMVATAVLLAAPASARGQATRVTAPENDYLLQISQQWGAESRLGDLRQVRVARGDIELRLWSGYGLTGSGALILRRARGRWSAWLARVHTCTLPLPTSVGDTLSAESRKRYQAEAVRRCGQTEPNGLSSYVEIRADTLELTEVGAGDVAAAWRDAVDAGVLTLPPRIPRRWMMLDGHTYVVELRRGNEYRASVIEHTDPPETEADRNVQRVYRRVYGLLLPRNR